MKDPAQINVSYVNKMLNRIDEKCHYDIPRLPETRVPRPEDIQSVNKALTNAAAEGGQVRKSAKTLQEEHLGMGNNDTPYNRYGAHR